MTLQVHKYSVGPTFSASYKQVKLAGGTSVKICDYKATQIKEEYLNNNLSIIA